MSACKPAELYFEQILKYVDAKSSECFMIGNDPVTDMAAVKKKILTFYVHSTENQPVPDEADYSGTFHDLANLLHI
jgi:ribonucleotide monophosphatase NagD (HAD superfamily)